MTTESNGSTEILIKKYLGHPIHLTAPFSSKYYNANWMWGVNYEFNFQRKIIDFVHSRMNI
jgi:hypothetical protein